MEHIIGQVFHWAFFTELRSCDYNIPCAMTYSAIVTAFFIAVTAVIVAFLGLCNALLAVGRFFWKRLVGGEIDKGIRWY